MTNTVEIILVPTLMIFLGYTLKRFDILKVEDANLLSKIVINISLPAMIFSNLVTASITSDMIILPITSFIVSFICLILALIYTKLRSYDKKDMWTIILAVFLMNSGFLGYPICLGLFGNAGFIRAVFFDFATALSLAIIGIILCYVFGGNRKEIIKNALLFMPLWAVIIGIIFNVLNIQLGYVFDNTLTYLGDSAIPLIMLAVGLNIEMNNIKKYWIDVGFVSIVRLVLAPIIVFLIFSIINVDSITSNVAIVESGMATAMNSLVLSIDYDLNTKLMSSIVFRTTIFCLITLPIIVTFLL